MLNLGQLLSSTTPTEQQTQLCLAPVAMVQMPNWKFSENHSAVSSSSDLHNNVSLKPGDLISIDLRPAHIDGSRILGDRDSRPDLHLRIREEATSDGWRESTQSATNVPVEDINYSKPYTRIVSETQRNIKAHPWRHVHPNPKDKQSGGRVEQSTASPGTGPGQERATCSSPRGLESKKPRSSPFVSPEGVETDSSTDSFSTSGRGVRSSTFTCSDCGLVSTLPQRDCHQETTYLVRSIGGAIFDSVKNLQHCVDHEMHENLLYCKRSTTYF